MFCSDYVDESHPVLDPWLGAWRIGIARTIIYFIFLKKKVQIGDWGGMRMLSMEEAKKSFKFADKEGSLNL